MLPVTPASLSLPASAAPFGWLRFGFSTLSSPLLFFPSAVVLDYGEPLVGWPAVLWLQQRGQLHPRAEAFGLWQDAQPDQLFVRDLDLSVPAQAFLLNDLAELPGTPADAHPMLWSALQSELEGLSHV